MLSHIPNKKGPVQNTDPLILLRLYLRLNQRENTFRIGNTQNR